MLDEAGIGTTFFFKAQREEEGDKLSLFLAAILSQKKAVFYFTSFIINPPLVTGGMFTVVNFGWALHSQLLLCERNKTILKISFLTKLSKILFYTFEAEILFILSIFLIFFSTIFHYES